MPATYAENTATAIQVSATNRPGMGSARVTIMAIAARISADAMPTAHPK